MYKGEKNNVVCWYIPEKDFEKMMKVNKMDIDQMKKCKSEKKRTLYSSCIMQGFNGGDSSGGRKSVGAAYCYSKSLLTKNAHLGTRSEYKTYYNNKLVLPYQTQPIKLDIRSYQIAASGLIYRINSKPYNYATEDFPYGASYKFVKGDAKGSNSEYQYKLQKTYIDPDSGATYYLYDAKKVNSHRDSYNAIPGDSVIEKKFDKFANNFKQMILAKKASTRSKNMEKYNNWYKRLATTPFTNITKNFNVVLFYKNPANNKITINYYQAALDNAGQTNKVTLTSNKAVSPITTSANADIGAKVNFTSNIGDKQMQRNPIRAYVPKTATVKTTDQKQMMANLVAVTAQEGNNKYALLGSNLSGNSIQMSSGVAPASIYNNSSAYANYINALYSKKCTVDKQGTTVNCYYAIPSGTVQTASVKVIYKNLSNPITDANGNVTGYQEVSNQYTKYVSDDVKVNSTISLINSTTKNANLGK